MKLQFVTIRVFCDHPDHPYTEPGCRLTGRPDVFTGSDESEVMAMVTEANWVLGELDICHMCKSLKSEAALQELADQAQELGFGYESDPNIGT